MLIVNVVSWDRGAGIKERVLVFRVLCLGSTARECSRERRMIEGLVASASDPQAIVVQTVRERC